MRIVSRIPCARATLVVAVIASAAAVGVSRSQPPARSLMAPVSSVPVLISPPRRESPLPATVWMEGDSGRTILLPPPRGMLLESATCSPWRDEAGRFQVVGRLFGWASNPWPGSVGLARLSFPDGELLDFVATDVIPVSPPCWVRGSLPRVVFAGGDGHLYRYTFDEDERENEGPSRLAWQVAEPPAADVFLMDPNWLSDTRFERVLLVVLRSRSLSVRDAIPAGDQLWWIELDEAGGAVIDAGPILDPSRLSDVRSLRSPVAGTTADGEISLALLAADRPRAGQWDLWTARLSFDPSGHPRPIEDLGTKLAGRCCTDLPPAFSAGGRCVRILQSGDDGHGHLVQAPLPRPGATSPNIDPSAAIAAGGG
jgi:hypothetical protein